MSQGTAVQFANNNCNRKQSRDAYNHGKLCKYKGYKNICITFFKSSYYIVKFVTGNFFLYCKYCMRYSFFTFFIKVSGIVIIFILCPVVRYLLNTKQQFRKLSSFYVAAPNQFCIKAPHISASA